MSTSSKVILLMASWRPSWIYWIVQGYPLDIRLMSAIEVLDSESNEKNIPGSTSVWQPDYKVCWDVDRLAAVHFLFLTWLNLKIFGFSHFTPRNTISCWDCCLLLFLV